MTQGPDRLDERSRPLMWSLTVLVVIQALHLLDSLRTDPETTFLGVLGEPQAIAGIGGTLLATWLVARKHHWGRPLAILAGTLVAFGFLVVHGLPVASEFTEPYWGEGSADALQWLGVLAIWVLCAIVVRLASATEVRTQSAQQQAV